MAFTKKQKVSQDRVCVMIMPSNYIFSVLWGDILGKSCKHIHSMIPYRSAPQFTPEQRSVAWYGCELQSIQNFSIFLESIPTAVIFASTVCTVRANQN